jgi:hypothetical protein
MVRDGVVARPPRGTGQKAWWLMQMVAATPLSFWPEILGVSPAETIAAAESDEWRWSMLRGLAEAAVHQKNVEWARAVLESDAAADEQVYVEGHVRLLDEGGRENYVTRVIKKRARGADQQAFSLTVLGECVHLWSPALTRLVLDQVRRHAKGTWGHAFRDLALRLSPELVDETEKTVRPPEGETGWWARAAEDGVAILRFRHDMLKELSR